ncbi:unnamed protein product [marine sediment metagenome]|uniref:endopeptidase La n=1 Tax=marine sediment metagenome TaxID=412755 RepID=X1AS17_9ZZZZ
MDLPWKTFTEDNLDITHAKEVLDEDHYGLEPIKDTILDFLAIRTMKKDGHTPILCFVGPPGVGKTSLGASIAKSIGRKFSRISVGGLRDVAEINGHRITYTGAEPGRFIKAIRQVGSSNPLIMIDEIDKIGKEHGSDPSSALLEVLDSEQNNTFYDNYLGIDFDLSKAFSTYTPLTKKMPILKW